MTKKDKKILDKINKESKKDNKYVALTGTAIMMAKINKEKTKIKS